MAGGPYKVDLRVADCNDFMFPDVTAGDFIIRNQTSNKAVHIGAGSNAFITVNPIKTIIKGDLELPTGTITVCNINISGSAGIFSQWSNTGSNVFITGSNIGIGLSNPAYPLDVVGDVNFSGTLRQNGVPFVSGGGGGGTSQWSNTSSNVFISGSNVGIGLSNPTTPLSVNGSITLTSNLLPSTNDTQVIGTNTLRMSNVWTERIGTPATLTVHAPNTNITGDVTISGNVTVTGSNFVANVQTVEVQDNIMLLNKNDTGNGVTAGTAGISIHRGTASNNFEILYDESSNALKIGLSNALQTAATREWTSNNYLALTGGAITGSFNASNITTCTVTTSNVSTSNVTTVLVNASNVSASNTTTILMSASNITTCNVAASNMSVQGDLTLVNKSIALNGVKFGRPPAGATPQTITQVVSSIAGYNPSGTATIFTLSNTQTDFRFVNVSGCNIVTLTSNQQLQAASNDSSNLPAYTWQGDSNTGMYHASNGIGLAVNGINQVTVSQLGFFRPNVIAFSAFLSANQAAPHNGAVKINFNATLHNVGGYFNTTTNTFTSPVNGYYLVNLGVQHGPNNNIEVDFIDVYLRVNEVAFSYANAITRKPGTYVYANSVQISRLIYLNVNDTVDAFYNSPYQAATISGGSSRTYLTMVQIA